MAAMYAEFFRFPYLSFHLGPRAFVIAALVTVASALLAVALAVRRAVVLPPAVAMQPEPPPPSGPRWWSGWACSAGSASRCG